MKSQKKFINIRSKSKSKSRNRITKNKTQNRIKIGGSRKKRKSKYKKTKSNSRIKMKGGTIPLDKNLQKLKLDYDNLILGKTRENFLQKIDELTPSLSDQFQTATEILFNNPAVLKFIEYCVEKKIVYTMPDSANSYMYYERSKSTGTDVIEGDIRGTNSFDARDKKNADHLAKIKADFPKTTPYLIDAADSFYQRIKDSPIVKRERVPDFRITFPPNTSEEKRSGIKSYLEAMGNAWKILNRKKKISEELMMLKHLEKYYYFYYNLYVEAQVLNFFFKYIEEYKQRNKLDLGQQIVYLNQLAVAFHKYYFDDDFFNKNPDWSEREVVSPYKLPELNKKFFGHLRYLSDLYSNFLTCYQKVSKSENETEIIKFMEDPLAQATFYECSDNFKIENQTLVTLLIQKKYESTLEEILKEKIKRLELLVTGDVASISNLKFVFGETFVENYEFYLSILDRDNKKLFKSLVNYLYKVHTTIEHIFYELKEDLSYMLFGEEIDKIKETRTQQGPRKILLELLVVYRKHMLSFPEGPLNLGQRSDPTKTLNPNQGFKQCYLKLYSQLDELDEEIYLEKKELLKKKSLSALEYFNSIRTRIKNSLIAKIKPISKSVFEKKFGKKNKKIIDFFYNSQPE